jgi:hypothetical protein
MLPPGRHYEKDAALVCRAKAEKAFLTSDEFASNVERIVPDDLFRFFGQHFVSSHMTYIRRIPVKSDVLPHALNIPHL